MWKEQDNRLKRTFIFKDFSEAFSFMTRVAMLAEQHNHHPNWSNVWNTVIIALTTHDAGNLITKNDRNLALAIDKLINY
nr:4a-hydroxytetrahydrobiopterin dehydratase [uncultured Emticicia sp.]